MSSIIWNYNDEKEYQTRLKKDGFVRMIIEYQNKILYDKISDEEGEKISFILEMLFKIRDGEKVKGEKKKESYKQKYMFNGFAKK